MEKPRKRPRRTNQQLEEDILKATKIEIEEKGFAHLTAVGVAKRANIEPSVFYKRYKNLNSLIEDYVKKYDYWNEGVFSYSGETAITDFGAFAKEVFKLMIEHLHQDKSMQELILWELSVDNDITRNSSAMREENTKEVVNVFEQHIIGRKKNINIRVFAAIMVSAIYYLIIHKGKLSFCGINFGTTEGRRLLSETIEVLVEMVFGDKEPAN